MTKPRLLITGGSGLLGINWAVNTRKDFEVVLLLNQRLINVYDTLAVEYKLSSYELVKKMLAKVKPDIIIHTAGLTNVELCEKDPQLAKEVNVDLADHLSKGCAENNLPFVQISTDHLFSGNKSMVDENTPVNPVNVYGATKAKAEEVVLNNHSGALVIRTNFYCWGTSYRQSFSDRIFNTLGNGNSITLFDDVFYTPVLAECLINSVHELLSKGQRGIFNIVGNERISKYMFGIEMASVFGLNQNLIIRGKVTDNNNLVIRPTDMSLSNLKLQTVLGKKQPTLAEQLKRLKEQDHKGISKEILSL